MLSSKPLLINERLTDYILLELNIEELKFEEREDEFIRFEVKPAF